MKKIHLGKSIYALVDDDDYIFLSKNKWYCQIYAIRAGPKKKRIYMHREIMRAQAGIHVDHINHNKLDNRKENLRFSSLGTNAFNRKKFRTNTSGFKGVTRNKSSVRKESWEAKIGYKNKVYHLGMYPTPELAALAYDKAAKVMHKNYACLNFPEKDQKNENQIP